MKKTVAALLALVFMAGSVTADLPEGFQMSRYGVLRFGSSKFQILSHDTGWSPQINSNWKNIQIRDCTSGKNLTARTSIGTASVSITSEFRSLSRDIVSSDWRFLFSEETNLNNLSGSLTIPTTVQRLEINGKSYLQPEKFDPKRYQVKVKGVTSLKFEYSTGRFVTIRSKSPLEILIQDNRNFNGSDFDIRFPFTPGPRKIKQSALALSFQLETAVSDSVDLSHVVNQNFSKMTGSGTPSGKLVYEGLEFELPSPAATRGKNVVVLEGASHKTGGIGRFTVSFPGKGKSGALNLLHTAKGGVGVQREIGTILVRYKAAPEQKIKVFFGRDVGEWQHPERLKNGDVVWISEESGCGLYASSFPLKNTDPLSATFEVTEPGFIWMVSAVTLTDQPVSFNTVIMKDFVRKADRQWLPLNFKNKVIPGSPLDFSFLKNDAPAGKYGQVVKAADGTLTFEKAPDRRLKLFGVNLCFSANYPTKEVADALAENLQRAGYNSVRFHHADDLMVKRKSADSTTLDPEKIDRLDYLFHALKKRGFYMTIDFYSSRTIRRGDGIPGMKEGSGDVFKALIPISPELMENWKKYVRAWMTHKNPYTGMTWAEDPALYCVNLVNEDLLTGYWSKTPAAVKLYAQAFEKWKTEHSCRNAKMSNDDLKFKQFLYEVQTKSLSEQRRFAREELGMKALFTSMNHAADPFQTILRGRFDVVDNHLYHDHPSYPERAWSLPSAFMQRSAIETYATLPAKLMPTRVFGLPFLVTEYNYCYPNRYRSEAGPLMGGYASLQDWDAIYRFAWAHDIRKIETQVRIEGFDIAGDPIAQLSDRITAVAFLRGDVKAAPRKYAINMSEKFFDTSEVSGSYPRDFLKLGLIAQIGSTLEASKTQRKQIQVFDSPGKLAPASVRDRLDAERWKEVLEGETAVSSTGEIRLERKSRSLLLAVPRTESVTTGQNSFVGRFLNLDQVSCFLTVAAISLDKKPLESSRSILLLHLTNVNNSNSVFGNQQMTLLRSNGSLPYLLQRGSAVVTLKSPYDYRITALSADGTPLGIIQGRRSGNGFVFKVDTGCFKGGVMAYHLTR